MDLKLFLQSTDPNEILGSFTSILSSSKIKKSDPKFYTQTKRLLSSKSKRIKDLYQTLDEKYNATERRKDQLHRNFEDLYYTTPTAITNTAPSHIQPPTTFTIPYYLPYNNDNDNDSQATTLVLSPPTSPRSNHDEFDHHSPSIPPTSPPPNPDEYYINNDTDDERQLLLQQLENEPPTKRARTTMQIFVRLPNGGQLTMEVEPNETIEHLRLFQIGSLK